MAFPTKNPHRRDRRKLGRGQQIVIGGVTTVVTGASNTATITFSGPVNVSGPIGLTVATLTPVTQTIVSPTVVTILFSGTVATHAWTLPTPVPNVSNYQGGVAIGGSGTFS